MIYTSNLGLNINDFIIFWSGIRDLRWRNLRDHLIHLASIWPFPHILVIHAGANEIGRIKTWELLCKIKRDLVAIKLFQKQWVPRLIWSSSSNLFYVDRIRRCLNRTIHNFLVSWGRVSFCHIDLNSFFSGLFWHDLVHLSIAWTYLMLGAPQPAGSLLVSAGGDQSSSIDWMDIVSGIFFMSYCIARMASCFFKMYCYQVTP